MGRASEPEASGMSPRREKIRRDWVVVRPVAAVTTPAQILPGGALRELLPTHQHSGVSAALKVKGDANERHRILNPPDHPSGAAPAA
jgi:hypothetical protein